MLTLDEAIKHCEEKAEEIRKANEEMPTDCKLSEDLCECAKEHEQLAGWLKDYKRLLEMPKGDLISREALKKAINNLYNETLDGIVKFGIEKAYKEIDNAPTVEIMETEVQEVLNKRCMTAVANEYLIALHGKRPQGEWIFRKGVTCGGYYKCNKCGEVERAEKNYCPNCGALMKGGAE